MCHGDVNFFFIKMYAELDLTENPVADKRLLKLIQQCRTKQVIDYVKQHGVETKSAGSAAQTSNKKKASKKNQAAADVPLHKIHVQRLDDATIKVSALMLNSFSAEISSHFLNRWSSTAW